MELREGSNQQWQQIVRGEYPRYYSPLPLQQSRCSLPDRQTGPGRQAKKVLDALRGHFKRRDLRSEYLPARLREALEGQGELLPAVLFFLQKQDEVESCHSQLRQLQFFPLMGDSRLPGLVGRLVERVNAYEGFLIACNDRNEHPLEFTIQAKARLYYEQFKQKGAPTLPLLAQVWNHSRQAAHSPSGSPQSASLGVEEEHRRTIEQLGAVRDLLPQHAKAGPPSAQVNYLAKGFRNLLQETLASQRRLKEAIEAVDCQGSFPFELLNGPTPLDHLLSVLFEKVVPPASGVSWVGEWQLGKRVKGGCCKHESEVKECEAKFVRFVQALGVACQIQLRTTDKTNKQLDLLLTSILSKIQNLQPYNLSEIQRNLVQAEGRVLAVLRARKQAKSKQEVLPANPIQVEKQLSQVLVFLSAQKGESGTQTEGRDLLEQLMQNEVKLEEKETILRRKETMERAHQEEIEDLRQILVQSQAQLLSKSEEVLSLKEQLNLMNEQSAENAFQAEGLRATLRNEETARREHELQAVLAAKQIQDLQTLNRRLRKTLKHFSEQNKALKRELEVVHRERSKIDSFFREMEEENLSELKKEQISASTILEVARSHLGKDSARSERDNSMSGSQDRLMSGSQDRLTARMTQSLLFDTQSNASFELPPDFNAAPPFYNWEGQRQGENSELLMKISQMEAENGKLVAKINKLQKLLLIAEDNCQKAEASLKQLKQRFPQNESQANHQSSKAEMESLRTANDQSSKVGSSLIDRLHEDKHSQEGSLGPNGTQVQIHDQRRQASSGVNYQQELRSMKIELSLKKQQIASLEIQKQALRVSNEDLKSAVRCLEAEVKQLADENAQLQQTIQTLSSDWQQSGQQSKSPREDCKSVAFSDAVRGDLFEAEN